MLSSIASVGRRWSHEVAQIGPDGRSAYLKKQLQGLLADRDLARALLTELAEAPPAALLRDPGLFAQEITLYLDPGGRFSLRIYFHAPGEHTVIHDHTAWGVIGTPWGRLSVMAYTLKKQLGPERVEFAQRSQKILQQGEVAEVKPWEAGIHQTGSPENRPTVMFSIYGRPGRRLYVNTYDAETGLIQRRYPIRLLRRLLAREALESLGAV